MCNCVVSLGVFTGKRFGFASYGKKSSAEAALRTLNDATVEDNKLVVSLTALLLRQTQHSAETCVDNAALKCAFHVLCLNSQIL